MQHNQMNISIEQFYQYYWWLFFLIKRNKQKQRHKCINKRFFFNCAIELQLLTLLKAMCEQDHNNTVVYLPSTFIPQVIGIGYLYIEFLLSDKYFFSKQQSSNNDECGFKKMFHDNSLESVPSQEQFTLATI